MIRVQLPAPLRAIANIDGEIALDLAGEVSTSEVLSAIEAAYPMLRGTIRDQVSGHRRAFVRFYACERDLSHDSPEAPLPEAVTSGKEPLLIVGAMAGG